MYFAFCIFQNVFCILQIAFYRLYFQKCFFYRIYNRYVYLGSVKNQKQKDNSVHNIEWICVDSSLDPKRMGYTQIWIVSKQNQKNGHTVAVVRASPKLAEYRQKHRFHFQVHFRGRLHFEVVFIFEVIFVFEMIVFH